jgi:phenylalanyl-tRNA synthetase beta chain
MKVAGPVVAFEVFLDAIPQPKKKTGDARPLLQLSAFQPVSRDFAFIVDAGVEADAVVRAARAAHKTLITDVAVFDIYQGKGVDPDKKSIAIAVSLQPQDKTLTDAEIESLSKDIVNNVTAKTGAQLRS